MVTREYWPTCGARRTRQRQNMCAERIEKVSTPRVVRSFLHPKTSRVAQAGARARRPNPRLLVDRQINYFGTPRHRVACTPGRAVCGACPRAWMICMRTHDTIMYTRSCRRLAWTTTPLLAHTTPLLAAPTRGPPCKAHRCVRPLAFHTRRRRSLPALHCTSCTFAAPPARAHGTPLLSDPFIMRDPIVPRCVVAGDRCAVPPSRPRSSCWCKSMRRA